MNIGVEIKKLRIEHGWTQEELATKLNRKKNSISQYENGTREPDLETIGKLANIFEVDTGHFFNNKETIEEKETFFTELLTLLVKQNKIKKIEDLNENQLRMIRAAINQQIEEINKAKG